MLRFALLLFLAWAITPAAAFGAGNIASISKIEGKNCLFTPRVPSSGRDEEG